MSEPTRLIVTQIDIDDIEDDKIIEFTLHDLDGAYAFNVHYEEGRKIIARLEEINKNQNT